MENLIFSINATLPIFLLMVLGYVLSLLKLVSRDFAKQCPVLSGCHLSFDLPGCPHFADCSAE